MPCVAKSGNYRWISSRSIQVSITHQICIPHLHKYDATDIDTVRVVKVQVLEWHIFLVRAWSALQGAMTTQQLLVAEQIDPALFPQFASLAGKRIPALLPQVFLHAKRIAYALVQECIPPAHWSHNYRSYRLSMAINRITRA
jgi:hypothetical protein